MDAFARELAKTLPDDRVRCNHLVRDVRRTNGERPAAPNLVGDFVAGHFCRPRLLFSNITVTVSGGSELA